MNKIVLITGGSRGIGAATATQLGHAGYTVIVNYKSNQTAAIEVCEAIQAKGGRAAPMQADVSQDNEVVALFERIDNEYGTLDALVNNAGILFQQMEIEEMSAERINKVLTTNVTSAFICGREAIKRMALKHGGKGGAIVNVSSAAARLGSPREYVDYAASKGAMDTFTKGLALEVADQGIRVNGVRPGIIYTDIHADSGEPGRVDRISPSVPMKRGGQPEEVAAAIVWLLSDEASYATGTFIDLAGGR